MLSRERNLVPAFACIAIGLRLAASTHAAPTWIGGNAPWNATIANWNPADEPDANDEAIFITANIINMAAVPEPAGAMALLVLGAGVWMAGRRRR